MKSITGCQLKLSCWSLKNSIFRPKKSLELKALVVTTKKNLETKVRYVMIGRVKEICQYDFCFWLLIDERTNITMYAITNSKIELDICYLLGENSPLNSENERNNESKNKSKNSILSDDELTTTGKYLHSKTWNLPILINFNLNSTLLSLCITAIHPKTYRQELQNIKLNPNEKFNTSSHILGINDLDLFSQNSANNSFSSKQGSQNIFTSLKLVNEANKKQKQFQNESIENNKVQVLQRKKETWWIKASYTKDIKLR